MVVYLDVRSRLDISAAQLTAREAIKLFTRAGEDAGKAFSNPLGRALGALDTSAMRRELGLLQGDFAKLAASEEEAARRMTRAMGQVEVAQRRMAELTQGVATASVESSARMARAERDLADARAVAAREQRGHVDAMVASETAAGRLAGAQDKAADSASRAGQVFNAVGIGSVAALGATMFETTKKAGDFQQSMTKLSAAASVPADQLKIMSDGILQMAGKVGYSTGQLSSAMFDIAKSGYNGADGLKVLNAAAQGANAEQADLDEVVKALTLSMHNFKATPQEASDVMSKMVTAVGESKVSLNDFAGALHSIEPQAAMLHLSLSDVWGVLSQITASGTSADQAAEQMANTMRSLSGANAPARQAMQQLGLDADDISQKLGQRGLAGTMQYLYDQTAKKIDPSTGLVNTGEVLKSAQAVNDMDAMLTQMSPHARANAEALRANTMDHLAYRKAVAASNEEDATQMRQFQTLNDRIDGFSKRLSGGRQTLETLNQALNEETGTMSGAAIVMQTTGDHADQVNGRIQKIADTVVNADGTVKGFSESQDTLNAKMRDAHAAFGAAEAEIGSAFVPVMMSAANVAKDVGDALAKHPAIAHDAMTALEALGTAWGAIKIANIAGTVLAPIATALGTLIAGEEGATAAAGGLKAALAGVGIGAAVAGVSQIAGGAAQDAAGPSGFWHNAAVLGTDIGTGAGVGAAVASVVPGIGTGLGALVGGTVAGGKGLYNMLSHAHGGAIFGHGPKGHDSVPAMLAPGEHVLTHHDVAAMGGHSAVYGFRDALHRAGGGAIGPDVEAAESMVGTAYSQGSRNDCSGMVGRVVNAVTGGIGLPTTQNMQQWLAQRGFVPGTGPTGTISVGWYNHGNSPNDGHAAMTLSDGENAESGGQHGNFIIGAGAQGASSSQFDHHMYLPEMFGEGQASGGSGGMGGMGGMGGGGFGGGMVPAGSHAGTGPGGQSGYYTPNPGAVDRAQEHLTHVNAEIQNAEDRKAHLKAGATQDQKDRLDEEIRHLNVERNEAEASLQKAQQGSFHAQRGGGRGSGGMNGVPNGLPVPLDDNMGTSGGLPGMAKWLVGWLEDLVLAPMENAVMAGLNGGAGGDDSGIGRPGAGMGMPPGGGFGLGMPSGGSSAADAGHSAPSSSPSAAASSSSPAAPHPASHPTAAASPPAPAATPRTQAASPAGLAPGWTNASGFTRPDTTGRMPAFGPSNSSMPPNLGSMLVPGYTGAAPSFIPSFGDPTYHASGGPSGTDTVPAWLTPGEDVFSTDDVSAMGGVGAVEQFRNALHRSVGGDVPQYFGGGGPPQGETPNTPATQPAQGQPAATTGGSQSSQPGTSAPGSGQNKPGGTGLAAFNPQGPQGETASGPGPVPGARPDSDTKSLPGLATPGADSNSPLAGLPSSPGIGVSGGVIGGAESAVASAAGMAADAGTFGGAGGAASSGVQLAFSELNRAASWGAQSAGIGIEGLLESLLPNSSSVGGDWATTIPGRILTGVSGVRPTAANTAGNTTKANGQSDNPSDGGTHIGFQLNGDQHVHSNDSNDFASQMQQASQDANGAYPQSTAGR